MSLSGLIHLDIIICHLDSHWESCAGVVTNSVSGVFIQAQARAKASTADDVIYTKSGFGANATAMEPS